MSNKVRFILLLLAGLAALGCLTAVILARRSEAVQIVEPKCGGKLAWFHGDMPVPVYLDDSMSDWAMEAEAAVEWWSVRGAFYTWDGVLSAFQSPKDPAVVFVADGSIKPNADGRIHAVGKISWVDGCRVRRVVVQVPPDFVFSDVRLFVVKHELGHGLGLDHSDWEDSVMYPSATGGTGAASPGELRPAEGKLLLSIYPSRTR